MPKQPRPANTDEKIYRTRVKRIFISLDAILEMSKMVERGLPKDSKPMGVWFDHTTNGMWMNVSSSEFEEVQEGDVIPILQ